LDLRQPFSPEFYESVDKALKFIDEELYTRASNEGKFPVVRAVGHTHIDVAWLWSIDVTRNKAVHSFTTVLELMERYPEYIFMSSQAQLYAFVKEDAPEVYERIKERVAEGRWETEGGMWVEADTNVSSGEALVRQFLYGKKFFREEFGHDHKILWLPDVFGYAASLSTDHEEERHRLFHDHEDLLERIQPITLRHVHVGGYRRFQGPDSFHSGLRIINRCI